jgi:hypothetical protein
MTEDKLKFDYNSTLTLANVFDELDIVISGNKKPDYNFLFTFNSFVESFVLTDKFFLHRQDYETIQLFGNTLFPNGRPIFDIMTRNDLLGVFSVPLGSSGQIAKAVYVEKLSEKISEHTDIKIQFDNFRNDKSELISSNFKNSIETITSAEKFKVYGYSFQETHNQFIVREYTRDMNDFFKHVFKAISNVSINTVLPQYGVKKQLEEIKKANYSKTLFEKLNASQEIMFEKAMTFNGFVNQPIPPLTSILLSRCKDIEEIPEKLMQLRHEFTELRKHAIDFEKNIERANTLKQQSEIIEEYDNFWNNYDKSKSLINRTVFRFWDIITESLPQFKHKGINNIKQITENRPSFNKQVENLERIFKTDIYSKKEYYQHDNFGNKISKTIIKQNQTTETLTKNIIMGDQHNYNINQAGAVGPNSNASNNTFNQQNVSLPSNFNYEELLEELAILKKTLIANANTPEHFLSIAELTNAEEASKSKNGNKVIQHLTSAGKWVFDFATKVGVSLVGEIIKTQMK